VKIMEELKSSCNCGGGGKTRIIYSCSGIGSNVGQLANAAACQLAIEGYGGGSCLAGVGGSIEKLVGVGKTACAKKILDDKCLTIDHYVMITELGIVKTPGPIFNENDVKTVIAAIKKS
jgi:uncharacterized metal-binding protein